MVVVKAISGMLLLASLCSGAVVQKNTPKYVRTGKGGDTIFASGGGVFETDGAVIQGSLFSGGSAGGNLVVVEGEGGTFVDAEGGVEGGITCFGAFCTGGGSGDGGITVEVSRQYGDTVFASGGGVFETDGAVIDGSLSTGGSAGGNLVVVEGEGGTFVDAEGGVEAGTTGEGVIVSGSGRGDGGVTVLSSSDGKDGDTTFVGVGGVFEADGTVFDGSLSTGGGAGGSVVVVEGKGDTFVAAEGGVEGGTTCFGAFCTGSGSGEGGVTVEVRD